MSFCHLYVLLLAIQYMASWLLRVIVDCSYPKSVSICTYLSQLVLLFVMYQFCESLQSIDISSGCTVA